jgi:hypothetical protein
MRRVHLPKRCPHPPHLAIVPSGFTKRELDPVPAISTTPPFLQSYTSQVLLIKTQNESCYFYCFGQLNPTILLKCPTFEGVFFSYFYVQYTK